MTIERVETPPQTSSLDTPVSRILVALTLAVSGGFFVFVGGFILVVTAPAPTAQATGLAVLSILVGLPALVIAWRFVTGRPILRKLGYTIGAALFGLVGVLIVVSGAMTTMSGSQVFETAAAVGFIVSLFLVGRSRA